jgi:hypothetical protein
VQQIRLLTPRLKRNPRDATDALNRTALEGALAGLGATMDGRCVNLGPQLHQPCTSNDDCNSSPGATDGLCNGDLVFEPPLGDPGACTPLAEIHVPVRQTRSGLRDGSKTIRLAARPSADPVTGESRPRDTDELELICLRRN